MKKKKKVKVAVRRSWGSLSPVTKVLNSKKKYKRSKEKENLRRELDG